MAQIEDYSPFLIGIKLLPGLPLDSIKKEMKKLLTNVDDYIVTPEGRGDIGITIGLPIEPIGLKENVEIKLNLQTESFNIIGDEPEKVNLIFEEIHDLLPQLPYDMDSLVSFYEIIAGVSVKTDSEPPKDILNNSFNVDLTSITENINPNISLAGIRISSLPTNLDQNDFFDLLVEPKTGSYSNRFLVQLRYQTNDKENITNFEVESTISQIINALEEK
ncbi:hypothetical protein [Methanobacterium sp.]|uniref:hypothetical protein n=1 Tax=Methanobacterium sp. TaxID=2164 RepID=UPI003C778772